jgi:hypothetical protein
MYGRNWSQQFHQSDLLLSRQPTPGGLHGHGRICVLHDRALRQHKSDTQVGQVLLCD